ncbi:MAG: hypothetical protein IKA79_01155 [Lentisphaeria bacterium]|nr:hypothetical protein [Lentisphaeria bacterium]
MKMKLFVVLLFICTLFTLSAADDIPIVWNSSEKNLKDFQTYAFGFLQNDEEYKFMFQIRSLNKLMENENSMLTVYLDTDNNSNTGRFEGQGWDLQLNVLLKRHVVSSIVWSENEIKSSYTFNNGEFSVNAQVDDNMLYITVKKVVYLKNIKIGKKFVLFEEHSNGKEKTKDLMKGVEINLK